MAIGKRALDSIRGILKRYGPSALKKLLWDREFIDHHWDFIDRTVGDCIYAYLEKHARYGTVLDLGCGPGNTATELTGDAYQAYIGVDISRAALDKARQRSEVCGRSERNQFIQADFVDYVPKGRFDVILFRESLYHVPIRRLKFTLDRYAEYLGSEGVFIVRLKTLGSQDGREKHRPKAILNLIARKYDVLEQGRHGDLGSTVVVFRPRRGLNAASGLASDPVVTRIPASSTEITTDRISA